LSDEREPCRRGKRLERHTGEKFYLEQDVPIMTRTLVVSPFVAAAKVEPGDAA